jgi:hypothetical protein
MPGTEIQIKVESKIVVARGWGGLEDVAQGTQNFCEIGGLLVHDMMITTHKDVLKSSKPLRE